MWYLYPTFDCNLNCEMCYISEGKRDRAELTFGEWIQILDLMMETRDKFFDISGGEPFIKKGIFQIFHHIRKKGGYTIVASNGTVLGNLLAKMDSYRDLPDELWISIDAATPDRHDKIRGKSGAFKRSMKCINKLSEIKSQRESNLHLGISLVLMNHNFLEFPKLLDTFKDYQVDSLYCEPLSYVGRGLNLFEKSMAPTDYITLILNVLDVLSREWEIPYRYIYIEYPAQYERIIANVIPFTSFQTPWNEKNTLFTIAPHRCSLFSESKAVSPYGDLTGCCKMSPILSCYVGNLLEIVQNGGVSELMKVIRESRYRFYESIILDPKFECSHCSDFYYCKGGCRAMALSFYSDLFAVDPRCTKKGELRVSPNKKFVEKARERFLSIFKRENLLSVDERPGDYPYLKEVIK